jgi:hypothetical protein
VGTAAVTDPGADGREKLAGNFRRQALGADVLGSPMYAELLRRMADNAEAGGATWKLLAEHSTAGLDAAYPLRVLGGAHRLALTGRAPDLARHFPSTDGDGDVEGAWDALRAILSSPPPEVLDALTRPPQTNEVGRSASLIGGFLIVAAETRRPVRALEIGSSAGLNLRFDQYRYEQHHRGFGPEDSRVRFTGLWDDGEPPFDAPLEVVERRGCDVDPIDAGSDEGRITLLSYVWPDQGERFERMSAALEIAAEVPATVDRADAVDWLGVQLAATTPSVTTVVYHSIMWQYLSDETQAVTTAVIETAGAQATEDAPLAWLRLEPFGHMQFPELRLTTWPGGQERTLAECSFHLGPVKWRNAPLTPRAS